MKHRQKTTKTKAATAKVLTLPDLYDMYDECNFRFFGGTLPCPQLDFMHKKDPVGSFTCDYYNDVILSACIMISDRYKYTDAQLRTLMTHEMIHYFLYYNNVNPTWSHGKEFRTIAKYMNVVYELNIDKYTDTSNMEMIQKESFFSRLFSKRKA